MPGTFCPLSIRASSRIRNSTSQMHRLHTRTPPPSTPLTCLTTNTGGNLQNRPFVDSRIHLRKSPISRVAEHTISRQPDRRGRGSYYGFRDEETAERAAKGKASRISTCPGPYIHIFGPHCDVIKAMLTLSQIHGNLPPGITLVSAEGFEEWLLDLKVLDANPLYMNQVYRLKFKFSPQYPIGSNLLRLHIPLKPTFCSFAPLLPDCPQPFRTTNSKLIRSKYRASRSDFH